MINSAAKVTSIFHFSAFCQRQARPEMQEVPGTKEGVLFAHRNQKHKEAKASNWIIKKFLYEESGSENESDDEEFKEVKF